MLPSDRYWPGPRVQEAGDGGGGAARGGGGTNGVLTRERELEFENFILQGL